ncbi:MAG: hypothetical protein V1746_00575 [bacterium]
MNPYFLLMYVLIVVFIYLVSSGTIEFRRNGEILNSPAAYYYSE